MNIFVSGLSLQIDILQLASLFTAYGNVTSATIVTDPKTARSRGFGFVTMLDTASAAKAIKDLNGRVIYGKSLIVNEVHPKENSLQKSHIT